MSRVDAAQCFGLFLFFVGIIAGKTPRVIFQLGSLTYLLTGLATSQ
jgi:hypothetical protein